MGITPSADRVLGQELLDDYFELTYLSKNEIRHIFNLLDDVDRGRLRKNRQHRFSIEQVEKILPPLRHNPFRESIYRVFSSERDGHLSFEDILDLCSAFSENCPQVVRATWAFQIFDFDGDNQISVDDLIEAIQRLTRFDKDVLTGMSTEHAERIARAILKEIDLSQMGTISSQEFVHFVARIPDFVHTFRFRI